jgi:hypothetical protein
MASASQVYGTPPHLGRTLGLVDGVALELPLTISAGRAGGTEQDDLRGVGPHRECGLTATFKKHPISVHADWVRVNRCGKSLHRRRTGRKKLVQAISLPAAKVGDPKTGRQVYALQFLPARALWTRCREKYGD